MNDDWKKKVNGWYTLTGDEQKEVGKSSCPSPSMIIKNEKESRDDRLLQLDIITNTFRTNKYIKHLVLFGGFLTKYRKGFLTDDIDLILVLYYNFNEERVFKLIRDVIKKLKAKSLDRESLDIFFLHDNMKCIGRFKNGSIVKDERFNFFKKANEYLVLF